MQVDPLKKGNATTIIYHKINAGTYRVMPVLQ